MNLNLVPEAGTDRKDGAAEPASPRLLVDMAVSRREKTGVLVAGELALSGTHAHMAVRPIRLPKLQGRVGLVADDALARVMEVRSTRRPQEAFPECLVESVFGRERR